MTEDVPQPNRMLAFAALASGRSQTEAAQLAGVSTRTLRRWVRSPRGKAVLQRLQVEMTRQTAAILVDASTTAARTLKDLAENGKSDSAKIQACRAILDFDLKFGVAIDFDERLTALELKAGLQNSKRGQTR